MTWRRPLRTSPALWSALSFVLFLLPWFLRRAEPFAQERLWALWLRIGQTESAGYGFFLLLLFGLTLVFVTTAIVLGGLVHYILVLLFDRLRRRDPRAPSDSSP